MPVLVSSTREYWGPPGVLLDANIFYARTFRDWVVQLYLASDTPLFHVRWTQDVLAEWIYKYRKTNPFVSDSDLGKWRRRVEQTFPRGEITGYEIDPDLPYQDPHDAHLHAAAAHGKVDYVVSQDKGFARFADNDDIPYEVYTADDFFVLVNDFAPAIVREAIVAQLRFHHRRGGDTNLPRMLKQLGADQFAEIVRSNMQTMDIAEVLKDELPPADS